MAERVTMQDIADALGVSRNTVSKAINNTGLLAEDTRDRVLKKAVEMGYKQFSYINAAMTDKREEKQSATGEIALLTGGFPGSSGYLSEMLDRFQEEFAGWGYGFTMHRVREEDVESLRLPVSLDRERTSGMICIEILDSRYCSMLCSLNLPIVFVEPPVIGTDETIRADYVCPDNRTGIGSLVEEMVRRGKRRIGFIGEYLHCQSFFERYMEYRNAMYMAGLPCEEEFCILGNKEGMRRPGPEEYREYLTGRLSRLKAMPEVFLCANDYVAFDTMRVFKTLGISVPQDVWICGFDDITETQVVTPSLTTVRNHGHAMGSSAAYLLASRIREPDLNLRRIHVQTSPVYRESTGD